VCGSVFGGVGRQRSLRPVAVRAKGWCVLAGASQVAMVQRFKDGVGWPLFVATVRRINLRHLLMAAALRRYFARVSVARRLAAAFVLTDEAFAMAIGWFRRGRTELAYYAAFAVSLYVLWNVATVVGMLLGPSIGEPRRFGVDFAITATFIAIVVLGVRRRSDAVVALAAALLASALAYAGASVVAVVTAGADQPWPSAGDPRHGDQGGAQGPGSGRNRHRLRRGAASGQRHRLFPGRIAGVQIPVTVKSFYYDTVVVDPLPADPPPLGLAEDFCFTRQYTDRPVKFSFTGPFSLAQVLNAEARALAQAGAKLLQIDEPFLAGHPEDVAVAVEAINIVTHGVDVGWGLHVCYGNRYARPSWEGHYDFLFPRCSTRTWISSSSNSAAKATRTCI